MAEDSRNTINSIDERAICYFVLCRELLEKTKLLFGNLSNLSDRDFYKEAVNIVKIMYNEVSVNPKIIVYLKIFNNEISGVNDCVYSHFLSVGMLAVGFSDYLGFSKKAILEIGLAGYLHDIGKLKIPSSILKKEDRLSNREIEVIRRHPELGFYLLKENNLIPYNSKRVILEHHERLDSSGYPKGLAEENICMESKIISIIDIFDAITSIRHYSKKKSVGKAINELILVSGKEVSRRHTIDFCRYLIKTFPKETYIEGI